MSVNYALVMGGSDTRMAAQCSRHHHGSLNLETSTVNQTLPESGFDSNSSNAQQHPIITPNTVPPNLSLNTDAEGLIVADTNLTQDLDPEISKEEFNIPISQINSGVWQNEGIDEPASTSCSSQTALAVVNWKGYSWDGTKFMMTDNDTSLGDTSFAASGFDPLLDEDWDVGEYAAVDPSLVLKPLETPPPAEPVAQDQDLDFPWPSTSAEYSSESDIPVALEEGPVSTQQSAKRPHSNIEDEDEYDETQTGHKTDVKRRRVF